MNLFYPNFEFEIRYPHILNFRDIYRELHAPFVKLTDRISIGNQNTIEERLILHFDSDNYKILSQWDRLNIRTEGDFLRLSKSNSIVETPFFDLYKKISDQSTFSNAINYIFILVAINNNFEDSNTTQRIKEEYFTEKIDNIVNKPDDIALVFDKFIDNKQINVNYGPYKGISDLQKRNILPSNPKNIPESEVGEMIIFKLIENTSDITFKKFKDACDTCNDLITNLWAK